MRLRCALVRAGGEADKLGNRYEGIFLARSALDLIAGAIQELVVEPREAAESIGVELYRIHPDGHREYWSIKRQRAKGSFTFAALQEPKPTQPQGLWGAAVDKLTRDKSAGFSFFTQTLANELIELPNLARQPGAGSELLRAAASTTASVYSRLRKVSEGDDEALLEVLRRFRAHALTEAQAQEIVDLQVRQFIAQPEEAPLEASAVRLLLADFVLDHLGIPIKRETVEAFLERHDLRLAVWRREDLPDLLDRWNASALARVRGSLINGAMIPRNEVQSIVASLDAEKVTLVAGGAGFGKSVVLADLCEVLREDGIPCALIRLDSLEPMTSRQLGAEMGLKESPSVVLGSVDSGVLIIDQLDAVSITSGRNPRLRPLVHELLAEAARIPGLRVVLACRSFELDFDDDFHAIAQSANRIDISPLDEKTLAHSWIRVWSFLSLMADPTSQDRSQRPSITCCATPGSRTFASMT